MTTIKKYVKTDEHAQGTYANAKLSKEDQDSLFHWVKDNGISNPLNPSEYHVTIIYSTNGVPHAEDYPWFVPIFAKPTGFEIFDSRLGRCLVLKVESELLEEMHSNLVAHYGATHSFPKYQAHITLSYNYDGDIPDNVPQGLLMFDTIECKGLDPDWKPQDDE